MNKTSTPNFLFLVSLEVAQIYLPGCGWSHCQIWLNSYWASQQDNSAVNVVYGKNAFKYCKNCPTSEDSGCDKEREKFKWYFLASEGQILKMDVCTHFFQTL